MLLDREYPEGWDWDEDSEEDDLLDGYEDIFSDDDWNPEEDEEFEPETWHYMMFGPMD